MVVASWVRRVPKPLFSVIPLAGAVACMLQAPTSQSAYAILCIGLLSLAAYFITHNLIDALIPSLLKRGLFGKDLSKTSEDKVPEALGIAPGIVTSMCIILFHPFFPHLPMFNAATTAITLTVLTGLLDDVLDLKWKTKIGLSFLATLPLIVAYNGPTNVIVPLPLRPYFGFSLELSWAYLIYMMLMSVFFTNSINIYAGVNGLESGQAVIMACSVVLHNILQLKQADAPNDLEALLFSTCVALPFLSSSLALFYNNAYPSKVFVGDTFTYTAGMTFAVCGILGKSSKTVMLFFVPQMINFVMSLPQLFHLLPCPRHRMPSYDPKTDRLRYSCYEWNGQRRMNLTLINLFLKVFGEMNEQTLCFSLLAFQSLCSVIAFGIRYYLSSLFY